MSAVSKSKLDVPESLIVNSCNLQLGKTIGQGMIAEIIASLTILSHHVLLCVSKVVT